MKIPTPSFFTIRLVILIIIFLVFCFLVGLVKDVFADWPGECTAIGFRCNHGYAALSPTSGGFAVAMRDDGSFYHYGSHITGVPGCRGFYASYYWENGQWNQKTSSPPWYLKDPESFADGYAHPDQYYPDGCPTCKNEKEEAAAECGGEENYTIDESTCEWECKPCTGDLEPGQESPEEAAQRCIAADHLVAYYDEEICRGICDTCTEEDYTSVKQECGKLNFTFSEVTCTGDCDGNCPPGFGYEEASKYCGPGMEPIGWTCEATPENGYVVPENSVTCQAPGETIYPKPTQPGEEQPEDPEPPEETPPADDPEDPEDNNEWNKALKENQDKQIQQNDKQIAELEQQSQLLEWIGDNQKITADNTKAIGEILQDGVKVELGEDAKDSLDDLSDGIQEVDNELETINTGSYTAPGTQQAYASEAHDFSSRTSQFLHEMKSTSLFSITDSLTSSIPGGGSSTLVIHGGTTYGGDHTIDFNWLSEGLNTLKYLFQIAGMILAILIVTIKKR